MIYTMRTAMKEIKEPDIEWHNLWKKFLSGDDKSFDLLYERYVQHLFVYGLQFSTDRELLKDCIQDVFVKFFEAREQLHHVVNINVYLRIALKNQLINALNREKLYVKAMDVSDFSIADEDVVEQRLVFDDEQLQNQNRIHAIMQHLTPQQQKVVHYRYIEDWSLEEISLYMGVKYQSTQNTLQRAIKKIKKHFFK